MITQKTVVTEFVHCHFVSTHMVAKIYQKEPHKGMIKKNRQTEGAQHRLELLNESIEGKCKTKQWQSFTNLMTRELHLVYHRK